MEVLDRHKPMMPEVGMRILVGQGRNMTELISAVEKLTVSDGSACFDMCEEMQEQEPWMMMSVDDRASTWMNRERFLLSQLSSDENHL